MAQQVELMVGITATEEMEEVVYLEQEEVETLTSLLRVLMDLVMAQEEEEVLMVVVVEQVNHLII